MIGSLWVLYGLKLKGFQKIMDSNSLVPLECSSSRIRLGQFYFLELTS